MAPNTEATRILAALSEVLGLPGPHHGPTRPEPTVRELFRQLAAAAISPGYFLGRLYPLPGWSPPPLADWQRPASPTAGPGTSSPEVPTAGELFEQAKRLEESRPVDPDDLADRFGLLLARRLAEAAPHPLSASTGSKDAATSADLLADQPLSAALTQIARSGVTLEAFWTDLFQVPGASRSWALDSPRWSEVMELVRRLSNPGGQEGR